MIKAIIRWVGLSLYLGWSMRTAEMASNRSFSSR